MWSSHLFRTFCRKVYRLNCQFFQGVQRFEKVYQGKPLWVSRTRRATSCATPRFFSFLSIFVSGQTCGQATYFERFVEKYTARIVRFFKGFSDFQKSLLQDRWRCPERCALPAALRLDVIFISQVQSLRNDKIITNPLLKVNSFLIRYEKFL